MKYYLSFTIFIFFYLNSSAQSDSIFTDLTSYQVDVCAYGWNFEGDEGFEYLTVYSDTPISDTVRIKKQNENDTNYFASLWFDGRKTWLKVDSIAAIQAMNTGAYTDFFNNHPYDEYILLYDFDVLDTVSVGDTIFFDSSYNIPLYIQGIDTIQINGVEKTRYQIITGESGLREDYLIEGVGGLHPFTPLLQQDFFGTCSCKYKATYSNGTDTLVLSDTMIFGPNSNYAFCLKASSPEYKKSSQIKIYPNPIAQGSGFTIETDNVSKTTLLISDMNGRQLKEVRLTDGESTHFIEHNFAQGLYVVKLIKNGKSLGERKLVVQ